MGVQDHIRGCDMKVLMFLLPALQVVSLFVLGWATRGVWNHRTMIAQTSYDEMHEIASGMAKVLDDEGITFEFPSEFDDE